MFEINEGNDVLNEAYVKYRFEEVVEEDLKDISLNYEFPGIN